MGDVDLSDFLVSLYEQNMKSKKWYMYIFFCIPFLLLLLMHGSGISDTVVYSSSATLSETYVSRLIEFKSEVGRPVGLLPPSVPNPLTRKPTLDVSQDCVDHVL